MHLRELAVAAHYTGIASDLRMLATVKSDEAEQAFMARRVELLAAYGMSPVQQTKPFAFSSGIAVIPVHGTLINRFGYSWSFVTGYNFIRQQTALAGQDPDVIGIVYDHNTYGGEAAGCFECSADLKQLANGKPTLAVVDSNSYSAGMALAVGADQIVVTPSGGVGSIGVVAMHVSYEKMLEDVGLKVTFIHGGAHKVDGNPYEDLPDAVKADIQKSIDKSYSAFVSLVAKGRKMDEKAVRATEARTFRAEDALSLGLIDAVATPQEAMRAFLGELSGSNPQPRKKEDAMSDAAKPGADNKAAPEELAKAQADATKAERARVSGIQTCEEAKGREALASHLAFNTEMTVDQAKAILAAAPIATAEPKAAQGNAFKEAMDKDKHPNVGAEGGEGSGNNEQSASSRILANARLAGVIGISPAKH
jgi:signal peptide peptidase SppA